ncbi:Gfo/Idh/MocA family oxidoreductase [Saccharopolyspora sp. NPDC002686]|uniref:Gfo/Idh/MocA family protein n=1 Tax=Saccharopolyspora sp. NPDC002686 TaxID=3154541 RepID=UPI0033241158
MPVDQPTISLGLLGCADIATRRLLPAFAAAPGVRIAAVASRSRAKAERVADLFGAEPVEGYSRLLDRADVDAVYVPLPPGLHSEWVGRALRAGKHVLCEKPLTTSSQSTEDLLALARARGLVLMENFMFPHHGQHARVRELVAGGAIGTLHAFSAAFAIPRRPDDDIRYQAPLGGGALIDVGGYPIAAAEFFLGGGLRVVGAHLRHDDELGVDLAGSALLRTPDGISATLTFGLDHFYGSRYELWGSAGRISVDHVFTTPATHRPVVRIDRAEREELVLPADDQVANSVAAFLQAVRDGVEHGVAATRTRAALMADVRRLAAS